MRASPLYTQLLIANFVSCLPRPLKHRQCAHRRHGEGPALQIRGLRLAAYHFLHFVYLLRIPGHHVESRAAALLGRVLRLHVGPRVNRASSGQLVGRHDGAAVHHGRIRGRVWARHTVPAVLFLPARRAGSEERTLLERCAAGEHVCWRAGVCDYEWQSCAGQVAGFVSSGRVADYCYGGCSVLFLAG